MLKSVIRFYAIAVICMVLSAPLFAAAPVAGTGNAVSFNGSDEYAEISYAAALNPSVFTVSLWARIDGGQGSYRSAITSRSGSIDGYVIYAGDDNNWQFWTGNGGWHNMGGSAVTVGEWVHLAAVYDGTTKYFYIDGELVNSAVVTANVNSTRPVRIGSGATEGAAQYDFNGLIDEVRVWNIARSQDDIRDDMYRSLGGSETGLAGYWNANQTSGTVLTDGTANGNDGTLYNTDDGNWVASYALDEYDVDENDSLVLATGFDPEGDSLTGTSITAPAHGTITFDADAANLTYIPDYGYYGPDTFTYAVTDTGGLADTQTVAVSVIWSNAGPPSTDRLNNALAFDASDKRVMMNPVIDLDADWTIECWFEYPLAAMTDWNTLTRGSNADHHAIVQRSTMLLGAYDNAGATGFNSSGFYINTLSDGWHHIAVTGSGGGQNFYIDGSLVGSVGVQGVDNISSVGNYLSGAQAWSTMDEIRVWDRALTQAEIVDGMDRYLTGTEAALMAYFTCDTTAGTVLTDMTGNGYTGTLTAMSDADWGTSGIWPDTLGLSMGEDDTLVIDAGTDDEDSATVSVLNAPSDGTVLTDDASLTVSYIPDAGWNGDDAFTYILADKDGLADTQAVTIKVYNVNDAPVFAAGAAADTVAEDAGAQTLAGWATGMDAGAADESTQVLSFGAVTDNAGLFAVLPAVDVVTGDLTYTPADDAFGVAQVTVTLYDDGGTGVGGVDSSMAAVLTITVTPVSDEAPVAGSGMALQFNGTDEYIMTGLDVQPSGMTEVTWEAWINPTRVNHTDWQGFLATDDGGWDRGIWITANSNSFSIGCGAQWVPPVTVQTNEWHHIAVVYKTDDVLFYYDGVEYSRGSAPTDGATVYNLKIGAGNGLAQLLQGSMDEIRIWDYARPAADILADMYNTLNGDEGNLAAYYRCDESGSVLVDRSAARNDGTLNNMDASNWIESGAWYTPELLEDDSISLSAGYDLDGDSLTFVLMNSPANGTLSVDTTALVMTYVPAADWFGDDTLSYYLSDGANNDTFDVIANVLQVNDAPSFTAGGNDTVNEDAGAQTLAGWATGIDKGTAIESTQVLSFVIDSDNRALFSAGPAVDSITGDLTYTPAADANGEAQVYIYVQDDGGTANGGTDVSAADTFVIVVNPLNDDPPVVGLDAGNALEFDGSDDHVRVSGLTDLSGSAITVEYWFKGTTMQSVVRQQSGAGHMVAGWNGIHTLSNDGGTGSGLSVDGNGGATVTDGSWHHVAFTWEQNTADGFVSYLDGAVVDMRTSGTTAVPNMADDLILGSYQGSGEFMNGQLDEVRIWNVARTAAEIRDNRYVPLDGDETGLVAYYRFNGTQGTLLTDHSVNGWDGTLTNMDDTDWIASPIWDNVTVNEDDSLRFSTGYHPEGDSATPAILDGPFNGAAVLEPGALAVMYTPAADYFGTDSIHISMADTAGRADTSWISLTVASVNDAPVVSSPAGDITFAEETGDSSLDLSAVFSDVDDTPAYWYYAPAQTEKETLFYDGFESGTIDPADWSTTVATYGRIGIDGANTPNSGSYHVMMDANWEYALNEMVLTIGVNGRRGLELDYYVRMNSDYEIYHAMPASFTGSSNTDGVAVSADGTTWYRADSPSIVSDYQLRSVDLESILSNAGLDDADTIMVKFQQYDRYPNPYCGAFYDDVLVRSIRRESADLDITVDGSGMVRIIGPTDFYGTEDIVFVAEDPSLEQAFDTVTVTVTQVTDPPVVSPLADTTDEDDTLYVSAGYHPDGDSANPSVLTGPVHGTIEIDTASLIITYVPDQNFYGTDSLHAVLEDTAGRADTAWIVITVNSVNDAPVAVSPAGDISFAEESGDSTIDLSSVFSDPDDTPAYWYYAPAQTEKETLFYDGFESGILDPAHWTATSGSGGQIVVNSTYAPNSGVYQVLMDAPAYDYALNELVLTVDLTRRRGVELSFWQKESGDEDEPMPASFAGSSNSDGVAVSADGTNWYRLVSLTGTASNSAYQQHIYDLDAAIAAAGIEYTGRFMIKFQQYDNYPWTSDGFCFDDISIDAIRRESANLDVTVAGAGGVEITGKTDFAGIETLIFIAEDPAGEMADDTVAVTVTNVDDAPVITSTVTDTAQGGFAYTYIAAGEDVDGDTVSLSLYNVPSWLTVSGDTLSGGAPYGGDDTSFTIIAAANGKADTVVVDLAVKTVNIAPSFVAGVNDTVDEDSGLRSVTGWATGLDKGHAAESLQVLTFVLATDNPSLFAVQPAVDSITGDLTYTPAADAYGHAVVTVQVFDDGGTADGGEDSSAIDSFVIAVNGVNDDPAPVADSFTVAEDETLQVTAATGVLANDTDIDLVDPSLIAYWNLNAATVSGTDVTDRTGNGNTLVLADGAVSGTGHMAEGAVLDGTNDYLYSSLNMPETDFTVAFWFNTLSATTGMFSVREGAHGGSNDRGIYLTGGFVVQRVWNTETITSTSGGFNDGQWHHVAMVVESGVGQRLYVDGVLEATGAKDVSDFNWDNRIEIGYATEVSPNFLTGSVDDIALWNRPVPESEIAALYNGGNGKMVFGLYSSLTTDGTNGTAALNADGSFSYIPDADFNGSDVLYYEVVDSSGGVDTGMVTITVSPVADPVTITSAVVDTTQELATYTYTAVLDDIDGDAVVSLENAPGWMTLNADTAGGTVPYVHERDTVFTIIASNGTYADTVTVALAIRDTNGVVPVELASFTASAAGASVMLAWTTVSERDNLGFNILRSSGSGAAVQVNSALIRGAGTTVEEQHYSFVDNGVPAGTWFYSIEQIDLTGASTVTGPVRVEVGTTGLTDRLPVVASADLPEGSVLFSLDGVPVHDRNTVESGMYLVKEGLRVYRVILVK